MGGDFGLIDREKSTKYLYLMRHFISNFDLYRLRQVLIIIMKQIHTILNL